MRRSTERLGAFLGAALAAAVTTDVPTVEAQTCYAYVDSTNTAVPFDCVQQGDLGLPCAWDEHCHVDGNPSDCCTSVPSASAQTVLLMHTLWHDCFGGVGAGDGNNPPGRGQRWYAFHRQFEIDFNQWRDAYVPSLGHIESLEWCQNMVLPHGHPSAQPGGLPGHPAGCGYGAPRPFSNPGPDGVFDSPCTPSTDDGVVIRCVSCEAFPDCLFFHGAGPMCCNFPGDSSHCRLPGPDKAFGTSDDVPVASSRSLPAPKTWPPSSTTTFTGSCTGRSAWPTDSGAASTAPRTAVRA